MYNEKMATYIVYREERKLFVAKCLPSSLWLEKKQTHMNEVILQAYAKNGKQQHNNWQTANLRRGK